MNYITLLNAGASPASSTTMILIWVVMIAFMYFMLIRPQRKKQKELQALQNSLEIGDTVLLNSGIYGKIVDKKGRIIVLELGLNKSVRVPIEKISVASKVDPDFMKMEEDNSTEVKVDKKSDKKLDDKKSETEEK